MLVTASSTLIAEKTKALETLPCACSVKYSYGDCNISPVPQIYQLKLPIPTSKTQLQLSL